MDLAQMLRENYFSMFIGTVTLLLLYFWDRNRRNSAKEQFPSLAGPRPLPFLGFLLDTIRHRGQVHLQFDDYYKKYGNLFSTYLSGKTVLFVSDPELIKEIMVKNFSCFHDRPQITKFPDPLDKMLTVLTGENWKRVRNTLTPTFSAHKMKMIVPLMNECVDEMLKRLKEVADSGDSINIYRYQQRLTLDVLMSSAFGVKTDCQTNPDDPVTAKARQAMSQTLFQKFLFPIIALLPFGARIARTKCISYLLFRQLFPSLQVARDIICFKRKGGTSGRKDLLDLMLQAENPEDANKGLSDSEIVANSTAFLLAGYETSATTLGLICYHLATNPDVQDKLVEEIDSAWSDKEKIPTYETVRELPYLDMVMSETLRLCPPGSVLVREAVEDCYIKKLRVPKGTPILVPVYSMHRDPNIWPDPERFDPMRFSPEAKQTRDPYTYMPFGHGPHNCIGMRFAQMEIKLALTRILKKFRFEVAPDTQIPPKIEQQATLTTPDGIMLKVVHKK